MTLIIEHGRQTQWSDLYGEPRSNVGLKNLKRKEHNTLRILELPDITVEDILGLHSHPTIYARIVTEYVAQELVSLAT